MTRLRLPTRHLLLGLAIVWFCASPAGAAETHMSPYAGEHTRPIKSLSPDDLAELGRGGGWGLAKAAELNGMPGPGLVFSPPGERREVISGLVISFSMWQCAGHGDAAGPGFVH